MAFHDPAANIDFARLADEIESRRLKFADVVDGEYEMPSGIEHGFIVAALRAYKPRGGEVF